MIKVINLMTLSLMCLSWNFAFSQTFVNAKIQTQKTLKPGPKLIGNKTTSQSTAGKVEKGASLQKAEANSNQIPPAFILKMREEGIWNVSGDVSANSINAELLALISSFNRLSSAQNIATLVLKDDYYYRLKIQLIHYFENADLNEQALYKLNSHRIIEIKNAITQMYLNAVFTLIQSSTIRDYQPIILEFKTLLENRSLSLVDLTPNLRKEWNAEKSQLKIHQYENFGLEEKKDGQYLINGLFVESKKTLAFDLNRSKYENLITIAHEIVHAADPELLHHRQKINELYSIIISKLQPHIPSENSEKFIKALIQDSFYEMGRFDIASSLQKLRDNQIQKLKQSIEKHPLENLSKDQDFKDFMRALIAITVENEYKAYTLSYALFQSLKNDKILPPLVNRQNFMQEQFKHQQSLAFTLSVAMNPFSKNTHLAYLASQTNPELTSLINQIKALFEINYLEQSKVMMAEVSSKYSRLFDLIQRQNEMQDEDDMPSWTKPGNFDSPSNPFQLLEAKVSTAWTIRFKMNLDTFIQKLEKLQSSLMSMRAGLLDMSQVSFVELKMLGMQPETIKDNTGKWVVNRGQFLPSTMEPVCRNEALSQINSESSQAEVDEYLSYFSALKWSPEISGNRNPVNQSDLMINLYRLNLLKAVRWLRSEMPQTQDNINGVKTMMAKLHEGNYDPKEISPERVKLLNTELSAYLKSAAATTEDVRNLEALMNMVSQMYYMALEDKWQPVYEEFDRRIRVAKRFLDDIGYKTNFLTTESFYEKVNNDVLAFRTQIRNEFSQCAKDKLEFYSREKKMTLGKNSFKVTGICYEGYLYLMRQTCDFNRSASTTTPYGIPHSKMLYGGREIKLVPFEKFGH